MPSENVVRIILVTLSALILYEIIWRRVKRIAGVGAGGDPF